MTMGALPITLLAFSDALKHVEHFLLAYGLWRLRQARHREQHW
jgi:hypothetical protein